jgi:hypothetical protein
MTHSLAGGDPTKCVAGARHGPAGRTPKPDARITTNGAGNKTGASNGKNMVRQRQEADNDVTTARMRKGVTLGLHGTLCSRSVRTFW